MRREWRMCRASGARALAEVKVPPKTVLCCGGAGRVADFRLMVSFFH
jgi:hypothetical protein